MKLTAGQIIAARLPGSPLRFRLEVLGLSDDGAWVAVRKLIETAGETVEVAVADLRDVKVEDAPEPKMLEPGNLAPGPAEPSRFDPKEWT